jgi:hypothetical protein
MEAADPVRDRCVSGRPRPERHPLADQQGQRIGSWFISSSCCLGRTTTIGLPSAVARSGTDRQDCGRQLEAG